MGHLATIYTIVTAIIAMKANVKHSHLSPMARSVLRMKIVPVAIVRKIRSSDNAPIKHLRIMANRVKSVTNVRASIVTKAP